MEKNSKFSTKQIAYMGILVAIGVVVNSLRIGKLSFGGLPIILSGYALGPIMGFIVGGVTDVVAFIVRPSSMGGPNPIFTMTSALTGMIPVIVSRLLGDNYPKYSYWKLVVGVLIGQYITSVLIVNFFIDLLYAPGTFWIKASEAAVKQAIQAPIYAYLIKFILDSTTKYIDFRNLK